MEQDKKYNSKLLKYFDPLENIFMLVFAIGLYFVTKQVKFAQYILWSGATVLAFLYLIKSFSGPKNNLLDYFIYKFAWLGLVLAIFGMIGKLLLLEKANMLLWISFFSMLFGFSGGIQRKFEENEIFEKKDYWRLGIVMVITVLFAIL